MLMLRWPRSVPTQRACVCKGQHHGAELVSALYYFSALARHVFRERSKATVSALEHSLQALAISEQCVEVHALLSTGQLV